MKRLLYTLAFASFLTLAFSRAQAAAGDLYDGGLNSNNIYKFTPAGTQTVFYTATNLSVDALAFDSKGNLYASDTFSNSILKITPAGSATTFATGLTPGGLAFDPNGNLFAVDGSTNSIIKYTPAGTPTTFKTGLAAPQGLAFDAVGTLFVTLNGSGAAGTGSIVKISPAGVVTPFVSGLSLPQGIVVDNANGISKTGNVYEGDVLTSSVSKFTSAGAKTTFAGSLSSPRSLAFDRSGNLFVGEFGANRITKITPAGTKTTFASGVFVGGIAFEPPTSELINISTRALVESGNNRAIAGFIIHGSAPKRILVRGLGPTLADPPNNLTGVLQDPTLELHNSVTNALLASNDNWAMAPNANQIPTSPIDYRPPHPSESAILTNPNLGAGSYTAVLAGKNNTIGLGLVEVYDLDNYSNPAELINVSTRAFVGTNNSATIGGFISSGGNGVIEVVIRGLGPTLAQPPFNLTGTLANPMLVLKNANGVTVTSNDNWKAAQQAVLLTSGYGQGLNDLEAAILINLSPANYTAILTGVGGGTGIGIVEVYKVLR